ncbi:MAG: nucleoside 2-deoxyribosyltransferase, partial [Thermoanaerobaculia bacterium]
MNMMVYISGPLQSASDLSRARAFYERLANECIALGWQAYLPHKSTDPILHREAAPRLVFERDYNMLRASQVMVADIGEASSGVGAELAIALANHIQVIALHSVDNRPSRFITGMLEASGVRIDQYREESEA